jgi:protein-S-isoprenylcysteine O-methyltransferase Ste14
MLKTDVTWLLSIHASGGHVMGRIIILFYGIASYSVFFSSFLYSIGFLGNQIVPKSIDSGSSVSFGQALMTNALLLGLFAVQHSIMARGGFKRWWTRFIPKPIERSTYVLLSSLLFFLLFWQWRPMTDTVWSVENPTSRALLTMLFWAGWTLVVYSSFLVNHFDLFGLRQVYLHLKGKKYTDIGFKTSALYRVVRHPIMLGYMIAFWSAPHMTTGHLFFGSAITLYILIGIGLEENNLVTIHGADYEEYQQRVSMLLPVPKN